MNTAELREVLERGRVPLADVARVIAFHKDRDRVLHAVEADLDASEQEVRNLMAAAERRASEPSPAERDLAAKLDNAERREKEAEKRVQRLVQTNRTVTANAAAAHEEAEARVAAMQAERDAATAALVALRARFTSLESENAALTATVDETYRSHLEHYARLEREAKEAEEAATRRIGELERWQRSAGEVLVDLLSDSARARDAARAPARALLAAS